MTNFINISVLSTGKCSWSWTTNRWWMATLQTDDIERVH